MTELRLAGSGFGPAEAEQVATLLCNAATGHEPTVLDLSSNGLQPNGLFAIANALHEIELSQLHSMSFRDCVACGKWDSREAQTSDGTYSSDGSKSAISFHGIETLLTAVNAHAHNRDIVLDLSFNKLGIDGAAAIARCLQHFSPSSTAHVSLLLGYNGLGSRGCALILQALQRANGTHCSHEPAANECVLQELDLRNNDIRDTGAAEVGHALQGALLWSLKLKSNHLGRDGTEHIAKGAVHSCPTESKQSPLRALELTGNSLGADGAEVLAHVLCTNSNTIEHLDVHRNNCSDRGARALARLVEVSASLRWLRLSNNNIREGDAALAQAIDKSKQLNGLLELLDVQRNPLSNSDELARVCDKHGVKHRIAFDGPI